LWFPERNATRSRDREHSPGAFIEFPIPTGNDGIQDCAAGLDSNLWVRDYFGQSIWKITTTGVSTGFASCAIERGSRSNRIELGRSELVL
jgi:hypothetical protein